MVAFNFKQQFAGAVERGEKRQTIRRSARCKPGDRLHLYTGQRTPICRLLAVATCVAVTSVQIDDDGLRVGDHVLTDLEERDFARRDGFSGRHEFVQFFREHYDLPFYGWLIEWKLQS